MATFRYWRLKITSWGGSGTSGAPRVQDLRFLGDGGSHPLNMTGATAPSPYVVTASSYYSDGVSFLYPWCAFDLPSSADSSRWHAALGQGTPAWLQLDVGTPLEITQIQFTPDSSTVFCNDFQILGSGTGSFTGEETVVADFAGITTGWASLVSRTFYLVPSHAQLAPTLPALTASIFSGPILSGQLPAPSASIFSAAQLTLALPMPIGSVRGGSNSSITLPMLTTEIIGGVGMLQGVAATLPVLVASALGGGSAVAALPALQGAATATFYGGAQIAAMLPALWASASGTFGGTAAAAATLPMLLAAGLGGANAVGTLPMLMASAGATVGGVGTVVATLPHLIAGLAGSRNNTISMAAILPTLRTVNSGVMAARLPALTGFASVYAVVAYTYEAYAVNLNHKPVPGVASVDEATRFTNYPFDKLVRWRNNYYGVAADGLYLLGGTTDNGVPIAWSVQTAVDDFGSPQKKTLVAAYLAGRFGNTAAVDLHVGEKGTETYSYASPRGPDIQNYRQVLGRGVKARYFALGLSGTEEFQLDELDFETLVLSRRI